MSTTTERDERLTDEHGDHCTATVYWDESDPQNVGYAYRIIWDGGREESGPCEAANPWQDVYEFLGPRAAYFDGSPLPLDGYADTWEGRNIAAD